MQVKKIIALFAVLVCFVTGFNGVVYADATVPVINDGISLQYEIAMDVASALSITNGTATCVSYANGISTVRISVEQYLQKHWALWIWNTYDGAEWRKTEDLCSINLANTKSGLEKGTYRLKSIFTFTDINGKTEKITVYSSERKVS